jgi:hypothetical protein
LIAATVADQRSRVPQSPVRSKIAKISAPQGRQIFFSDRLVPTTHRTPSQSTSRAPKTRLASSRIEVPPFNRERSEQLHVTRFHAPHTAIILAPRESLHLFRGADSCASWCECPRSHETRQRAHRALRTLLASPLRLAASNTLLNTEVRGRFRAPLPSASMSKGTRLGRNRTG